MNDFHINGFLGEEAALMTTENYNKNIKSFQYCEELIRYTIALAPKINIANTKNRDLIIGCLFLKILNATQSVLILISYGLDVEANTITRTALESLYWLAAIIKRPTYYKKFIDTHGITIDRLVESIKKNPENYTPETLEQVKDYQPSQPSDTEFKPLCIDTVAMTAKLKVSYDNAYTILSLSSHPDLKNIIDRYLITDNEEVISFNALPSYRDLELILSTNCFILLTMLERLNKHFKLEIDEDLDKFEKQNEKLFNKK